MDSTVRIWDLRTGQCQHVLNGHTSLVGLLAVSPSYLVSASADATLRVWNPSSGELVHVLEGARGAITAFQHDDEKVLSGADGVLTVWDPRTGARLHDLLSGIVGVWQIAFKGRWCAAASNLADTTVIDVWDFGDSASGASPDESEEEESDHSDRDDKNEDDTDWVKVEADTIDEGTVVSDHARSEPQ